MHRATADSPAADTAVWLRPPGEGPAACASTAGRGGGHAGASLLRARRAPLPGRWPGQLFPERAARRARGRRSRGSG